MAFRDENGRITIDETAAQKDVNTITQAIENLKNAERALTAMINSADSSGFSGLAVNAMIETTGLLNKNVGALIEELRETIEAINRIVAFYQRKDAEVRELIVGGVQGV